MIRKAGRLRIGIDLGHAQVRVVAARPGPQGMEFVEARQAAVVGDNVTQALHEAIAGLPVKTAEVRVVMNAARRAESWNAIVLCEQEGFLPQAIVSSAEAVAPLVERLDAGTGAEAAIVVVDLGQVNSELAVIHHGEIIFQRPLPVNGQQVTQAMVGTLSTAQGQVEITPGEAERLKRAHGFAFDESGLATEHVAKSQLAALIRPQAELLSGELFRLFQFFHDEHAGVELSQVWLCGAGAAMNGLDRFLAQQLGLEVRRLDPFAQRGWPAPAGWSEADRMGCAAVVGAVAKEVIVENLLPVEYQERAKRLVRRVGQRAAIAGACTLLIVGWLGIEAWCGMRQAALSGMRTELAALQAEASQSRQRMVVTKTISQVPHVGDLLKELSHVVPRSGYLTHLTVTSDDVMLAGIMTTSSAQAEAALSDFARQLEEGIAKGVTITQVRQLEAGRVEFTVTGRLE